MKISLLYGIAYALILPGFFGMQAGMAQTTPAAEIKWTETTYDFGKIPMGKPVIAEFQFTNPSMIPLLINSVKPTCGCTIADYPKGPVSPQKGGSIKVTFNAASPGYFQKSILVNTNAGNGTETLIIKGEVIPLDAAAK